MSPTLTSRHHVRLAVAIGFGAAMLALLLFAISPACAQAPTSHDVVLLVDNSPSVRTGEGAPDGQPTDPALVRLRLTRFVVNVLGLSPAGTNQRVGAISFARSTQLLMPLTPVRDWSKADFAAIRELDQGQGTDFAAALDAASQMLFPPGTTDCSTGTRRCDIVVVTDGFFDDRSRDRPRVEAVLQTLRSRGVSVHVLTFAEGHQDMWQELLTDTLISTYRSNVALDPPGQVYDTVLGELGAEALLTDLTPVEVAGEQNITLNIPPFRTWIRYQVLPDSPLTVTFLYAGQAVTPVVAGTEYTLFQPQAGDWQVRLQGEGLAYYRKAGEGMADLSLYLHDPEELLAMGEEVTVRAGLTAGGAPVTDLTPFTVTATIGGAAGITGPLKMEPDEMTDLFATSVPSTWFESGVYTVALAAESTIPGVGTQPVMDHFEMVALPTLELTLTPTGPIWPGQSVYVTVTVENWRQGYTPELWRYERNGTAQVLPLLTHRGSGLFTAEITSTRRQTEAFAAVVRLPVPRTLETLQSGPLRSDPRLVIYLSRRLVSPLWYIISGFLVCALFFAATWGGRRAVAILTKSGLERLAQKVRTEDQAIDALSREFDKAMKKAHKISELEDRKLEKIAQENPSYTVALILAEWETPINAAGLAKELVASDSPEDRWFFGGVAGIILNKIIEQYPDLGPEILNRLREDDIPGFVIDLASRSQPIFRLTCGEKSRRLTAWIYILHPRSAPVSLNVT